MFSVISSISRFFTFLPFNNHGIFILLSFIELLSFRSIQEEKENKSQTREKRRKTHTHTHTKEREKKFFSKRKSDLLFSFFFLRE